MRGYGMRWLSCGVRRPSYAGWPRRYEARCVRCKRLIVKVCCGVSFVLKCGMTFFFLWETVAIAAQSPAVAAVINKLQVAPQLDAPSIIQAPGGGELDASNKGIGDAGVTAVAKALGPNLTMTKVCKPRMEPGEATLPEM